MASPGSWGRWGAAVALLLVGADARANFGECSFDGDFTSQITPGPDCPSPVGFCTTGTLSGPIEGVYAFVMTGSSPAPTAEHPSREVFTGYSTITTADGVMYGNDTGEIWFDGTPGFVTTVNVYDGDACYAGTDGVIVATGELDLVTGFSVGTYVGELSDLTCDPWDWAPEEWSLQRILAWLLEVLTPPCWD